AAVGYYGSWIEQLPAAATMGLVASVFLLPGLVRLPKRNTLGNGTGTAPSRGWREQDGSIARDADRRGAGRGRRWSRVDGCRDRGRAGGIPRRRPGCRVDPARAGAGARKGRGGRGAKGNRGLAGAAGRDRRRRLSRHAAL